MVLFCDTETVIMYSLSQMVKPAFAENDKKQPISEEYRQTGLETMVLFCDLDVCCKVGQWYLYVTHSCKMKIDQWYRYVTQF